MNSFIFIPFYWKIASEAICHQKIELQKNVSSILTLQNRYMFYSGIQVMNVPVWLVIDIWRVHVLHCKTHFRCDRRPPFSRLRSHCRAIHSSINMNRPNYHAPFHQYHAAFSSFAMNFHWISLSMHNSFANYCLLWNQTKQIIDQVAHNGFQLIIVNKLKINNKIREHQQNCKNSITYSNFPVICESFFVLIAIFSGDSTKRIRFHGILIKHKMENRSGHWHMPLARVYSCLFNWKCAHSYNILRLDFARDFGSFF